MERKLKALFTILIIGLIGFMFGVIANIVYFNALPILMETFPYIFASSWIAWGLGGALIAIICCIIYAYLL